MITALAIACLWLGGALCGATAMSLYITGRYQLTKTRRTPKPKLANPAYKLADDLDVPLIEVVLDAEARADPNYWKPKTWADVGRWVAEADTLRPSPQLPDPHRTATEHAHAILNMRDPLEEEVV